MAGAEHEPVAVRPGGVGRGVAEVARPQRKRHRRHAHRRAGMARVCLLDAVDREGADRVDRQLVELVRGGGHRCLRVRGTLGGPARPCDGARGAARAAASPHRSAHRSLDSARCRESPLPGGCPPRAGVAATAGRPAVVVLGDLVVDVMLLPARDLQRGTDVPGLRPPAPGRQRDHDRALARPARARAAASCARSGATRWGGRSSWPSPATASSCARSASPGRRPDGSACSWSPAASGRSSRTGGRRSGCARRTSSPSGSRARTRSICPAYSLLDQPLGLAGMAATQLARDAGALVTRRPQLHGAAAVEGPPCGAGADRGGAPGPHLRNARRVTGARRVQEGRRGAARARADRRRQARPQGRDDPRPGRQARAPVRGRHDAHQGHRHDRRRRRVQRRVPPRLAGRQAQGPRADRGAPAGRRGRQPGRAPPPVEPAGRAPARLSSGVAPTRERSGRTSRASASCGRCAGRSGRSPGPRGTPRGRGRTRRSGPSSGG